MQAAQGHVFVVAASHLIFLLRQPSHALITIQVQDRTSQLRLSIDGKWGRGAGTHTLQPLVAVMLVNEDIVWGNGQPTMVKVENPRKPVGDALFWVSRGC